MLTTVTSLTGNGLKDWLIQRVSAVYLLGYLCVILGYVGMHRPLDYLQWSQLFHCSCFKIATILALLMFVLHAWIGIWTVTTDYLRHMYVRVVIQVLVALFLSAQFIWGIMIVWGQ
jgi:succinate dehydrogenase / fumarate reductase membrane anchor subunit